LVRASGAPASAPVWGGAAVDAGAQGSGRMRPLAGDYRYKGQHSCWPAATAGRCVDAGGLCAGPTGLTICASRSSPACVGVAHISRAGCQRATVSSIGCRVYIDRYALDGGRVPRFFCFICCVLTGRGPPSGVSRPRTPSPTHTFISCMRRRGCFSIALTQVWLLIR
jgi:hypothetical protein